MQQALEKQILFENHKEAYALLGERDEFLRLMRDSFACQFISRGDRIELSGDGAEVEQAAKVLEELQYLYRQGTPITMHEVRYGIGLVKGGRAEALEFRVDENTRHRGEPLKSLKIKPNILLVSINHASHVELPNGDSCYQTGDGVVIVTNGSETIYQLNDIFA